MPEEDELSEETREIIDEEIKEAKKAEEKDPLEAKKLEELREMAKEKDIKGYSKMNKEELIDALNGKPVEEEDE